jgi:hypothetical protein
MTVKSIQGLRLALGVVVGLTLSATSSSAFASYTYTIKGSSCRVMQTGDESLVTVDTTAGTITANDSVNVICPMVKHTSSPGGFDEYIADVAADVVSSESNLACELNIYGLQIQPGVDSIIQSTGFIPTPGGPFDLGGFSTDIFWDEGIATPYTNWYSSEVICQMNLGTTINKFTVTENGSLQSNYRIFSASNCAPTLNSSSYDYFSGESGGPSGFWEAKQQSGFTVNCPVPSDAGRGVQLSAGPSISGGGVDQLQCSSDGGSHWITVPQNPPAAEPADFPTQTVSFAVKSGAQNITCKMTGINNDGDGKIASYRTFPLDPIPHTGWTATASIGANTGNAFDGNLSSRWTTTNQSQRSGQWFKLDMGSAKTFIEVVMDSGGDANDYPHGYKIEASMDGNSWTTIATGSGTSSVVTVPVPMTTARFIRLNQTATDSHWWSIHELNVYSATPHNPYL